MADFLQDVKISMKNKDSKIVFPECTDPRILQAINQLLEDQIIGQCFVFLKRKELLKYAKSLKLSSLEKYADRIQCVGEDLHITEKIISDFILDRLPSKPISLSALKELCKSPLYQAGYLLNQGQVDCALAGAIYPTSEVIRAALRCIGKAEDVESISGSFLMHRDEDVFLFADAGVNIEPTLEQLVDFAVESLNTWTSLPPLAKRKAHVAFLSFSTKGSAKHKSCTKMAKAAKLFAERCPKISVDGELQFDAAFDRDIGKRKAPGSPVAGKANIFIFPDLNSANIAYKITQRLAGFAAYGPILQGLKKPYSDLSRGSTVEDIVACSYINLLRIDRR